MCVICEHSGIYSCRNTHGTRAATTNQHDILYTLHRTPYRGQFRVALPLGARHVWETLALASEETSCLSHPIHPHTSTPLPPSPPPIGVWCVPTPLTDAHGSSPDASDPQPPSPPLPHHSPPVDAPQRA